MACGLLLSGCFGLNFERSKIGVVDPVHEARHLEEGKATLREMLEKLGPPDLLLKTGDRDRAYYVFWDSDYFKFILKAEVPLVGRSFSWDFFILAIGSEDLHLARLDFDRGGVLRDRHTVSASFERDGEFFALDNTIVENFLEDRERALHATDNPDDDDP